MKEAIFMDNPSSIPHLSMKEAISMDKPIKN